MSEQRDLLERMEDAWCDLVSRSFDSCAAGVTANICQEAMDEIRSLRRRVTVLEMVIRQDLQPADCSDDLNLMVVDDIHKRFSVAEG